MARMISYDKKNTPVHKLSGVTKLLFLIIWCMTSAMTFDTRILVMMLIIGAVIYYVSKVEWKQVGSVFTAIMFFMVINLIFIYILAPFEGCRIYGSRTEIVHLAGNYYLTKEQLFYEFNVLIKYFTVIPSVFIFLTTTDPSELAASLNGIGVPYTIAYSLEIALRYIPDVQDEFHRIKNSQEARGIEMSNKGSLLSRIKNIAAIIFPLLFSSMERIEVVSNAMELRGFGKKKKRSWYSKKKLSFFDYAVIISVVAFAVITLVITYADGNRFYNPFGT
ncbi:energy-coupling factor transporter transmembrane component T family protein [Butyrivibrio sp. NC2002]|uniref:energy-coupling factor transporter transmembrane component T family protein n=1 Tax=Butyrivibrio sp. NC2002 TaxID=1410610 RepID=UPI000560E90D|nr:energy-coupling factor transporter transmembrane component T [Butyrivibrio sp. NC2002]